MTKIEGYKDLIAWQKAMDLVEAIYRLTKPFPSEEKFGLTSLLRRAAVSIPSNFAEGYSRRTRSDYVRFLEIARGSANEIETQLLIAVRLRVGDKDQVAKVMEQLTREQREVIGLRFFGGLTSKEVGGILNKSDGAVREMQRATIEKLRRLLAIES